MMMTPPRTPIGFASFGGLDVQISPYATMDGAPVHAPRSWRERLFSRPWRPWISEVVTIPQVPASYIIEVNGRGVLVVHPALFEQLKSFAGPR